MLISVNDDYDYHSCILHLLVRCYHKYFCPGLELCMLTLLLYLLFSFVFHVFQAYFGCYKYGIHLLLFSHQLAPYFPDILT